jgi:hypothetical protein
MRFLAFSFPKSVAGAPRFGAAAFIAIIKEDHLPTISE